jgi:protein arginine kinase activator
MKCDFCDQKATVFLTQLVEGQMKKVCLCEACAEERGVTDPTGFSLGDVLFSGMLGASGVASEMTSPPTARLGNGKQCATCGFLIDDLKRVRRFGCSDCYATFREEVSQMIRGMHKGTSHIGKVPEGLMAMQFKNQRLEELRGRLDQAISAESYEEAAGIRDEIRNLDGVKI